MYRMAEKERWSDERLDDLNVKVDRGFEQVDKRFEQMDRRFEGIDQRLFQVLLGLAGLQLSTFGILLGFIVALH